jgi:hypothetical protein
MNDFLINVIGWLGALSVLLAYLMVSVGKWEGDSTAYQGLNLLGGVSLIINTIYFGAYPSTFVNLVWVGIAIFTLTRGRGLRDGSGDSN